MDGLRSQLGNGDEVTPQKRTLCKGMELVVDVVSMVDDNKIPRYQYEKKSGRLWESAVENRYIPRLYSKAYEW